MDNRIERRGRCVRGMRVRLVGAFFVSAALVGMAVVGTAVEARAQPAPRVVVERVQAAFAAADPEALLRDADDRVEIGLFGAATLYSRAQAGYVMRGFFRDFPPEQVVFHESTPAEASYFALGTYRARDGQMLRIYVRLRRADQQWRVRELRVEARR